MYYNCSRPANVCLLKDGKCDGEWMREGDVSGSFYDRLVGEGRVRKLQIVNPSST